MILIHHLAATILVIGLGLSLLSVLRRPGIETMGWGEFLAVSYLLGVMAMAGSMELLDRLSVPVRPLALLLFPGIPAVLLLGRRVRESRAAGLFPAAGPLDAFRERRGWEWLLIVLIAAKLAYVLTMNLAGLLRSSDAYVLTLPVAKAIHYFGSRSAIALPSGYPPFPGLILGWFGLLHRRWDEFAINLAYWNYYAALLCLFHAGLRRYAGRGLALAGTYLLSSLPLLLAHAVLIGYADLPMAVYLTAFGIYVHRYAREGRGSDLVLAILFALCLPAIKLEGTFPYLGVAILCLLAAVLHRRGGSGAAAVAGASAALFIVGVAAILLLEMRYGTEGPAFLAVIWGNIVPGDHLSEIGGPLVEHFLWGYDNWMLVGPLAAAAFPLLVAWRARGAEVVLAMAGGLVLAAFVYLYVVGGASLWLVNGTVVNRSFLQIMPLLLFTVLVLIGPVLALDRDGAAARAARR